MRNHQRSAALELVDNQSARLERKLFVHNGGHAVCGYVGFHRQHRYVHEAVADPVVARHVLGALDELGDIVQRKHGFSAESIDAYKKDLCLRGAVPEMRDEILRVVRDPIRKLSARERLGGAGQAGRGVRIAAALDCARDCRRTKIPSSAQDPAFPGAERETVATRTAGGPGGDLQDR